MTAILPSGNPLPNSNWHDYLVASPEPARSGFRKKYWTFSVRGANKFKVIIMASVNINNEDNISIKDFEDGNSIQVRVNISPKEKAEYDKGKKVKVVHEGTEMEGKIVSEPIVIDRKGEDGKITLSLIIEKG
jgi:hypothetical protein